jgi:hypothetical protein
MKRAFSYQQSAVSQKEDKASDFLLVVVLAES